MYPIYQFIYILILFYIFQISHTSMFGIAKYINKMEGRLICLLLICFLNYYNTQLSILLSIAFLCVIQNNEILRYREGYKNHEFSDVMKTTSQKNDIHKKIITLDHKCQEEYTKTCDEEKLLLDKELKEKKKEHKDLVNNLDDEQKDRLKKHLKDKDKKSKTK